MRAAKKNLNGEGLLYPYRKPTKVGGMSILRCSG